jgi:hypothetical protein
LWLRRGQRPQLAKVFCFFFSKKKFFLKEFPTMRLIALFNLKPGISVADYEAWARSADIPTVNKLASVSSFRVFRTTGLLGSDAKAPYAYVETIDIDDMDGFWNDVGSPAMQEIAAAFAGMADVTFMTAEDIEG